MLDISISKSTNISFELVEDIFNKLEDNLSIKTTKRSIIKSKPLKVQSVPNTAKNIFKDKLKKLLKAKPVSRLI